MGRSKLRAALAAEKGVDIQKLKQRKKHRERVRLEKKKGRRSGKLPGGGATAGGDDNDEEDEELDDEWEDEEDEEDEDEESGDENGLIDDMASETDDDEGDDEEEAGVDIAAMDDSDTSGSDVEMEAKIERPKTQKKKAEAEKEQKPKAKASAAEEDSEGGDSEDDEEEEDEEDVPFSDLDEEDRAEVIVHQRQTINNTQALLAALQRIRLPTSGAGVTFASHQCVVSAQPTAADIPDVQDDLARELQFYRQSQEAAVRARALLRAEKVPFSRPADYFAEMVKDDGHMEKVKAKLVEEATAKKAATEARRQRDLKKFGKQVQVAKLQERQKAKKDTLEKIKLLKRKRQESSGDMATHEADLFDVAVDNELSTNKSKTPSSKPHSGGGRDGKRRSSTGAGDGSGGAPNPKRQKKDAKYGFGGKKRHAKSGDAVSSGDMSAFSARRMKAGGEGGGGAYPQGTKRSGAFKAKTGAAARPGKARRKAAAGRR